MTQMTVNGSITNTAVMNKTTLYVSPYTTVNNTNISKHYYAGSERLMTNTGRSPILGISTHLGTAAQLTAKRNAQRNLLNRMATNCWNKTYNYSRDQLSYLTSTTTNAYASYYYHTDHLGSSSWISNSSGAAQQYLVYLPFGETLLDRRANTTWNTMFSFSGKERDLETGYSYFGARYYDAGTSIWLSVDPMSDKYPGVSPYNYCFNNPIRFVDPDGRDGRVAVKQNENGKGGSLTISSTVYITGANANTFNANEYTKQAQKLYTPGTYTDENGGQYSVNFDVKFQYVKDMSTVELQPGDNVLNFDKGQNSSYVSGTMTTTTFSIGETSSIFYAGTTGKIGEKDCVGKSHRVVIHETLHFLGLSDRYSNNAEGKSIPFAGFKNDIMGSYLGTNLNQKHYDNYGKAYSGKATGTYILQQHVDKGSDGTLY